MIISIIKKNRFKKFHPTRAIEKNEVHTRNQSHSQGTRTIHNVQNSVRNTTSLII